MLLAGLLATGLSLAAAPDRLAQAVQGFKAGRHHVPTATIATLSRAELSHATRSQNISGLLALASKDRGRVLDEMTQLQAAERFNRLKEGDLVLLGCLKVKTCEPLTCADIAGRSELHREVLLRQPSLNLTQVNHAVGDITERVMVRHFEVTGWSRIEGQIGRSGIDGLFVKHGPTGAVREVLIVESKYNTSALRPTNHGEQMSREWVEKKLRNLRERHPDEATYQQVATLVGNGHYRARLWTMRVTDEQIDITIQRVRSTGAQVDELIDDPGTRVTAPPSTIRITAPQTDLEQSIVAAYARALRQWGARP